LPLVPTVIGFYYLRNQLQWVTAFLLFVPSFLSIAFLTFVNYGGQPLAAIPRFAYIAYPAIYVLTAVTLANLTTVKKNSIVNYLICSGSYIFIVAYFILNNIDVFGVPWFYFWFHIPFLQPFISG